MKVGLNSVQLQGWRHQGIQLHLQGAQAYWQPHRVNKAEVDAGHFEDFLIDKKTKLISVLDGEKAEKVLNVRVSCDVISVL